MNIPGWQKACPFLPLLPLQEKTLVKSGIMWFHNSAFHIPSRPALTFHGQTYLSQTWVPLPQFLLWVFPNISTVDASHKASQEQLRLVATEPKKDIAAPALLWQLHQ